VVCEKRTALEVLHNALVEKGLNYHCVLIRDIVKDRRNVVDSVRDRIDSSEYRKYRYKYSKDSLDNSISRAKELITSINKKHQKLAQQLLGNKVWSDVVGDLLSESKGYANDAQIILDTSSLSYTKQELSHLLDVTQKAQGLYREYQPFEKYSFINPNKFVGENPYSVEEIIHRDFDYYSNKLLELKDLLKSTKVEYVTHRKHELSHQLAEVGKQIDGILEKENKLEILLNNWRSAHQHLRVTEFDRQILSVESITRDIEAVYKKQQGSPDFTNNSKINSAGYKVLSWFSSSKKEILADHVKVNGLFTKLEQQIIACKDIPNIRFQGDLAARNGQLTTYKNELSNFRSSFEARMGEEFNSFNFDSAFDSDTVLGSIKTVEAKIRSLSPDETKYKALLESIRSEFHTYFDEKKELFKALTQCLAACSDVNSDLVFDCSFGSKRELLANLNNELRNAEQNFDAKVHGEFEQIEILGSSDSKNLERLRLLQETAKELCDRVINDCWTHKEINSSNFSLFLLDCDEILQRKQEYFGARADLFMVEFKWFQFYNNLTNTEQALIRNLKPSADWRKSFILPYLHSLLVKNANLDLPTSDIDHVQLSTALQGIEKEQLKYIKEYWYSQQIDATRTFEQLNGSLTVANLYNKKSGTRHKRLALRQIVQYDANLFTTFFPIILTSPDVCSNLFKGMNDYFDIVMFDEASQLRLEDNLPAILKGKQVVIAGDEHQMPPSNYFSKVFDGSIEDEEDYEEEEVVKIDKDDILLSCESLLDFGTELNFDKRHLDFHYRSRHPYLIDFSNHAFYSQRLKPLPNNFEYVPIKYVQVGGTFSDHTNDSEAEMVLSILENNINRLPNGEYPTVGIATFNISQRNLIKSKILERQKFSKFEAFNSKIQELEEKGMFVKNLENIQGDERDVIILSTTYGVGKDGKFAQRFGPINQSKGYKLLNVIITRAKYKVYVCSSIPEQVFMNYKDYLVTEGNNKRAVYYAYLAYAKGVSDKNDEARLSVLTALSENTTKSVSLDEFKGGDLESPFEEEVYQTLSDHFGADKLIPQMQFAGFRIDIVYNSGIAGVPKIAIECDGAKYHTSKEAYLYDRHRQKILEKHGFVFHRIWSTNWWRNTPRETDSLVEFIKKIEASKAPEFNDYSKTALAFTDDVAILERHVAQLSFDAKEDEEETIKSLDQKEEAQPATTQDQVKPTSLVHIKYVNNGKFMKVQIVETDKIKNDPNADVQKIFVKSPLAESMLGYTAGQIVKVGNLDNFVEIMSVHN
jgi:transcription elongation GreA/GreB family factor